MPEKIAVIGAGAMGTAVALALERSGQDVTILATAYDRPFLESLERDRTHPTLGMKVPPGIEIVGHGEWAQVLGSATIAALAVATSGVRSTVREAAAHLAGDSIWAIASKGWDPETAEPLSAVVEHESPRRPVVVIAGPSLAVELAAATPTGVVCASRDPRAAGRVAAALASTSVRAYVTDDVAGVEVGAALKNVLAIAIGMCDGLAEATGRPMTNTKAALFSRGLVEMSHLARALGGRQETVLGLAGAGDLFVTVLGGRNGRFGRLIGAGHSPEEALREMGTTVEGYENAAQAAALAGRLSLELEVVEMVHAVLHRGLGSHEAITGLMRGRVEPEL